MESVRIGAALCAVGSERVVSNELRKMGIKVLEARFGRVRFQADTERLYRAMMGLRAADRVLVEAACFPAEDFDALFEGVRAIPWEEYIPRGMSPAVAKVRSSRSRLQGLTSMQAVAHKALAERLCKAWGLNRLDDEGPKAEIRLYAEKDQVSVFLDISGEPLFKRGYRSEGGIAPLRETTAAAMLLLTGWRRKFPLYDPFCGSGTIAIEAAMYAWDMAPGLGRNFTLSEFLIGDRDMEKRVREELLAQVNFSRLIRIYGSDADTRAVSLAQSNARRACALALGKKPGRGILPDPFSPGDASARAMPLFKALALQKAHAPEAGGCIVTNPPYGRRLGDRSTAEAGYSEMAVLRESFRGWKLCLITDHPGFESHFGQRAGQVRKITNGAAETYIYEYPAL